MAGRFLVGLVLLAAGISVVVGALGAVLGSPNSLQLFAALAAVLSGLVGAAIAYYYAKVQVQLANARVTWSVLQQSLPERINKWGKRWAGLLGVLGLIVGVLALVSGTVLGILALS